MISLYINNKKAIIKNGTSIKLTRENPFFTNSGDYTFDVVLPLDGCPDNQKIFGVLYHPSISLKFLAGKTYPFVLVTEILTLEGEAVVTNVTHEDVKVQLLSGNSALNFDALGKDGEKYIDELDLGRAYGELWQKDFPDTEQTAMDTIQWLLSSRFTAEERENLLHGDITKTHSVCFPIYSQADGAFANIHEYSYWGENEYLGENDRQWRDDLRTYTFPYNQASQDLPNSTDDLSDILVDETIVMAPQPYLAVIVERVLGALGYTLSANNNALRSGWFAQIFVANARGGLNFAACLPHWTVKEFFDELRKTFGMIVFINGKQASVVSRETIYDGKTATEITLPIDERNTDIDEDGEQKDTTSGNVGYDFTDSADPWLSIGEEAYDKMSLRRVADDNITTEYEALTDKQRSESNILFYTETAGSRFAIFKESETTADDGNVTTEYALTEVDQMGPLFRDEDFKVDTKLRIIPCFMSEDIPVNRVKRDWGTAILEYSQGSVYPVDPTQAELDGMEYGGFHVPFLVTADTRAASELAPFSLYASIMEDVDTSSEENEKQSVLEVACNCGVTYHQQFYPNHVYEPSLLYDVNLPYPVGVPYYRSRMEGLPAHQVMQHVPNCRQFLLHDTDAPMFTCLNGGKLNIDTRVVRQISFIDNQTNPHLLYLINGRKYVCQKIEITLDEHGVQPLKKGFFFEVE